MNKINLKKYFFSFAFVSLLTIGLVGCLETGSVITGDEQLVTQTTLLTTPTPTPTPSDSNNQSNQPLTATPTPTPNPASTPTPTPTPPAAPSPTPTPTPSPSPTPTPPPGSPFLTVTAPLTSQSLYWGQTFDVGWTIANLPANPKIDIMYRPDNQTIKQLLVTDIATTETGSYTINTSTGFLLGQKYVITLRLKSGTKIITETDAPGQITVEPTTLQITTPVLNSTLTIMDNISMQWKGTWFPPTITLEAFLDPDSTINNGNEIVINTESVSSSGKDSTGAAVVPTASFWNNPKVAKGQYYRCGLRVKSQNGQILAAAVATGLIQFVNTSGVITIVAPKSTGEIDNVGIGGSYAIQWVTSPQTPAGSTVKLYLDEDGNFSTTADQIEVTPAGGVAASLNSFLVTFDASTFLSQVGHKFYVFAKLFASTAELDSKKSVGQIQIGAGSVIITNPSDPAHPIVTEVGGPAIIITWNLTGAICESYPGLNKVLRLYLDETPQFTASSFEITPPGGIDACGPDPKEFSLDTNILEKGKTYYVIARIFIMDTPAFVEAQSVSAGTIITTKPEIFVLTPAVDQTTNLDNIQVSWNIANIDPTALKVKISAVLGASETVLAVAVPAPASSGVVSMSRNQFPAGAYTIRCVLFGLDAHLNPIIYATGDAPGKIIITSPTEYQGEYDLSKMGDPNSASAIYGTIFEGYNIDDGAGCEVAGLGDIDNGGYGDFVIFTQKGQEYNVGNAGSGYVIYGKSDINTFSGSTVSTISLNSILGNNPPVEGSILLLPLENVGANNAFTADVIPDVSNDGKGDLQLKLPASKPLSIAYSYLDALSQPYFGNDPVCGPTTSQDITDLQALPNNWYTTKLDELRAANPTYPITDQFGNSLPIALGKTASSGILHSLLNYTLDHIPHLDGNLKQQYGKLYLYLGTGANTQIAFTWDFINYYVPGDGVRINVWLMDRVTVTKRDPVPPGSPPGTIGKATDATFEIFFDAPCLPPPNPPFTYVVSQVTPISGEICLVTSNQLRNYKNTWYDMELLGDPSEPETGASRGMVSFNHSPINFNNTAISYLTDVAGKAYQATTYSLGAGGIDYSLPTPMPRDQAGVVFLTDPTQRKTVFDTPLNGTLCWFMDIPSTSGPSGNDSIPRIFGPETYGLHDGSTISDVLGLGRYSGPNDRFKLINGDFNGDGLFDFVVLSPKCKDSASHSNVVGTVFIPFVRPIIFQAKLPYMDLAYFNTAVPPNLPFSTVLGVRIEGTTTNKLTDATIKSAGNFNSDGNNLANFLFAMPKDNSNTGKVVLVFGQNDSILLPGTYSLDDVGGDKTKAVKGMIIKGEAPNDEFGKRVCNVGDVNDDGIDDLLIAAPMADYTTGTPPTRYDCGKVYLVYGKANLVKTDLVTGETFVDYDNDGLPDGEWSIKDLVSKNLAAVFIGEFQSASVGAISPAGDVNGDGMADFLIGSPKADLNSVQQNVGKAYLILGRKP